LCRRVCASVSLSTMDSQLKDKDWKCFLAQAGVSNESIHKYSEQLIAERVSVDLADSLTQDHLTKLGFSLASPVTSSSFLVIRFDSLTTLDREPTQFA